MPNTFHVRGGAVPPDWDGLITAGVLFALPFVVFAMLAWLGAVALLERVTGLIQWWHGDPIPLPPKFTGD